MLMKMTFYEDFARAFLIEAKNDFDRAKKAFNENDFPHAVFNSQQCVEKAVKAMIEAKREYVYNHGPRLASIFIRIFEDEWIDDYDEIVNIIGWFSEYYTRARYPFMFKGKVVMPSEYINREIAEESIRKAEKVLEIAENYLRKKRII